MDKHTVSIRINKYLAQKNLATRRGADELIEKGLVYVNGVRAKLGAKVQESDRVEVRGKKQSYVYYAYNKPVGVITHSPQRGEKDVKTAVKLSDVFPIGRLDKASHGLLVLTNDGRITDKMLNPDRAHEKEYIVTTTAKLRPSFKKFMEAGVEIGEYRTKKCKVQVLDDYTFRIVLTEGKKHQIRRMCEAMHNGVKDLQRVRIMNIKIGSLADNAYRELAGEELQTFLRNL